MIRNSRFFFPLNSRHTALYHLKQFLNSRPYLQGDGINSDVFDAQFQSILADFQNYHRLTIQDGTLNAETYAQIGGEMTAAHIEIISAHSQMLKYLLHGARCSYLGGQIFLIIGFTNQQFSLINEQVKFMGDSSACTKAFENAGLVSVHSMIFDGGLVFVHANLLGTMANNAKWGGSEPIRTGMDLIWRSDLTTADVTPVGPQDGKSKYVVSLNGTSFNNSVDTVPRVIIHSLMHAGGAKANNNEIFAYIDFPADRVGTVMTPAGGGFIRRPPIHDLEWMNYKENKTNQYTGVYDDIMEKSTPK